VKPAPFEYARPADLPEALALLQRPGAKILAGGQSLVPLLNLRLARPELLVDVNAIGGLSAIEEAADGGLRLGALLRHARLLADPRVADRVPLLREAVKHVGHHAVRNRGTLGGSLVHADPVAELATAMVALGARIHLVSEGGERWIPARDFFQGPFTTEIAEEEMLTEVLVPGRPEGEGAAFFEVAMRQGDFAIVAVAALAQRSRETLRGAVVVWSGAASTPVIASELKELEGLRLSGAELEEACAAVAEGVTPPADVRASSDYKRATLGVLSARALRAAAA
jgi:carbon-monoxide dehydrogenase medium subunit